MRTYNIKDLDSLSRWTLFAMFELSAASQPVSLSSLAHALSTSPVAVRRALSSLEARGLVWPERCTLTLQGLALAAALASRHRIRSCAA